MEFKRVCVLALILWLRNICGFDIIELNHDLGPNLPFYPFDVNTTFKSTVQEAGYSRGFWLAYSEITIQMFISTFVGAPNAFYEHGITVDQIPFRNLFATAAVIDVREKVAKNDFYDVTVSDVKDWIKRNGMFPKHCIVLFNTGWDVGRYPDQIAYFGTDDIDTPWRGPGASLEAINYILSFESTHGIHFVGFGLDSSSIDNGRSVSRPNLQRIAKTGKYIVFSMKELHRLPPKGAKIMVMPMKIKNGEAAPARVAARIP